MTETEGLRIMTELGLDKDIGYDKREVLSAWKDARNKADEEFDGKKVTDLIYLNSKIKEFFKDESRLGPYNSKTTSKP